MAKKQHILHHYKNEKFWFGVSNPVFDFIFGTLKDGKDVELSETARNLEKKKQKWCDKHYFCFVLMSMKAALAREFYVEKVY